MQLERVHRGKGVEGSEATDGSAQHLAEHLLVPLERARGGGWGGALGDRGAGLVLGGHGANESHSR